jgi:hydrogenase maturation protease
MKTLVIGLGNPILTDDGVGVRVAEAVRASLPPGSPVETSETSVGGLSLMERLLGYERVILIDALCSANGRPGSVHRLTLDNLRSVSPTQHCVSAHDTNLNTALRMAGQMGLPLPDEVVIYGVEVENTVEFGDEPTPAVRRAIGEATDAVLAELNRLECADV